MKRIICIMVLLIALTGCGLQTTTDTANHSDKEAKTGVEEGTAAEAASVHEVRLDGGMDPQKITASVGDVVVWRVADGKEHKLLGDMVDSGDELTTGSYYQVTLDEKGTFAYHDVLEGGSGLIHVR